jgi:hypothetical protein
MEATHHLVSVWNPSYANNAMEEHLAVLLHIAALNRDGKVADNNVYVWWGRVRSIHRRSGLPHLDELKALEQVLASDDPPETHLYLTDYRSLYVAEVGEIHFDVLDESEADHVPQYYAASRLECDFWFKLWDIRRLVADDTVATIMELQNLRNIHYHDQPVSLYGGIVDLPLIVTRADATSFFDDAELDAIGDAALWAEFDSMHGAGMLSVERALRDDLLGAATWSSLGHSTRTFIASGEKVYREHRDDPAFDFATVLGAFSKAIEVQLARVLPPILRTLPRERRLMNIDGRTVDLAERRSFGLAEAVKLLTEDGERARAIASAAHNGAWLTGQFPAILDAFRDVRNPGTHSARIDRRTATRWRDQMLGVGSVGHLVELARVRSKQ